MKLEFDGEVGGGMPGAWRREEGGGRRDSIAPV